MTRDMTPVAASPATMPATKRFIWFRTEALVARAIPARHERDEAIEPDNVVPRPLEPRPAHLLLNERSAVPAGWSFPTQSVADADGRGDCQCSRGRRGPVFASRNLAQATTPLIRKRRVPANTPVRRTRIGISGWKYPPWRGVFYPPGLRQASELSFASRVFPTIELNGSFYSLQRPDSYRSWHDATPDDFIFAVKGGRYITHMKRLRDVKPALANFFASGLLCLGK